MIGVLAVFAWSLFATSSIYPHLTSNNDEAVYLFQAQMLRHGHVTLPADTHAGLYRPWMSGVHEGEVLMVFPPTWPAALAGARLLFGRPDVAVAFVAAGLVAATYWLGRETFGRWRPALVAAGSMAASPFVIIHAATRLSYLFALLLEVASLAAVVRADRTGSSRWFVVAGFMAGLLFTARPYDSLLVGVCVAVYVVAAARAAGQRARKELVGTVGRVFGFAGLGAALPVLAILAYNARLSGSPFTFPLHQTGGNNAFGFGPRWIVDGAPVIDVTPVMAAGALRVNLGELPHWLFGSLIVVPLIGWGWWLLYRRQRPIAWLLAAVATVVPAGFVLYWGNLMIVNGRYDLGPHYYLALLIPAVLTTAAAVDELLGRRRLVALGLIGGLAIATAAFELPHKLGRAEAVTALAEADLSALRDAGITTLPDGGGRADQPAVVVLPSSPDGGWILHPRGYLANPIDMDTPVIFAADRDSETLDLFGDAGGGRSVLRFDAAVDPLDGVTPRPTVTPVERVLAPRLVLTSTIVNRDGSPVVSTFANFGRGGLLCVLDHNSVAGQTYQVRWIVDRDGVLFDGECTEGGYLLGADPSGLLTVGAAFGASFDLGVVPHVDLRFWARPVGTDVEIAVPGVGRRIAPQPSGTRTMITDVGDRLTATVAALG
jgi:hypothetical protein